MLRLKSLFVRQPPVDLSNKESTSGLAIHRSFKLYRFSHQKCPQAHAIGLIASKERVAIPLSAVEPGAQKSREIKAKISLRSQLHFTANLASQAHRNCDEKDEQS